MNNKAVIIVGLSLLLLGCAAGQEKLGKYWDNPQYLIKDQEFEDYKAQLDALEKEYLKRSITYADYLERKKVLEGQYDKQIMKREEILASE